MKLKLSESQQKQLVEAQGDRCFFCAHKFGIVVNEAAMVRCFVRAPVWETTQNVVACQLCCSLLRGMKFNKAVEAVEFVISERKRTGRAPFDKTIHPFRLATLVDAASEQQSVVPEAQRIMPVPADQIEVLAPKDDVAPISSSAVLTEFYGAQEENRKVQMTQEEVAEHNKRIEQRMAENKRIAAEREAKESGEDLSKLM